MKARATKVEEVAIRALAAKTLAKVKAKKAPTPKEEAEAATEAEVATEAEAAEVDTSTKEKMSTMMASRQSRRRPMLLREAEAVAVAEVASVAVKEAEEKAAREAAAEVTEAEVKAVMTDPTPKEAPDVAEVEPTKSHQLKPPPPLKND